MSTETQKQTETNTAGQSALIEPLGVEQPREEIEALKRNWESDPCWDLWATEGFEAHEQELRQHQDKMEKYWGEQWQTRIKTTAQELDCSFDLARYVIALEERLNKIEALINP